MTRVDNELPFFFGHDHELFGIHHAASHPGGRAVLLCAPLGQDYIRCHRLYRQLAVALAAEGHSTLRFDYYGCGDSAGDSDEVDWHRCLADTVVAANELRARSGADQVLAFGARLGGSLALAAASAANFDDVVVWDPIIDGQAHAATLDALQDAMRQDTKRFVRPRASEEAAGQWLGFPVNTLLRQQIAGLRAGWSAVPSLLLDSLASAKASDWRELAIRDAHVAPIEPATPWDELSHLETAILCHPLVHAVVAHWREHAYA
ncbi:serine aminopeptidase domain-containing protein [Dyella silvae]|uniref:serine aminopeptidase domain-containing protein n=1 Tax=Dyella silvae TaxID=2994424 RepID=UPI00226408CA|nr:alpha/beta hydrolase [Dyella silvae]